MLLEESRGAAAFPAVRGDQGPSEAAWALSPPLGLAKDRECLARGLSINARIAAVEIGGAGVTASRILSGTASYRWPKCLNRRLRR